MKSTTNGCVLIGAEIMKEIVVHLLKCSVVEKGRQLRLCHMSRGYSLRLLHMAGQTETALLAGVEG